MKVLKSKSFFKSLFLATFPLFLFFLLFPKSVSAVTCSGHVCAGGQCSAAPDCRRAGSPYCNVLDTCSYVWTADSSCPGCGTTNPPPGTTTCTNTDCTKADGTPGCDTGTCSGTKPNPPGTGCSCAGGGGGGGTAPPPVDHYPIGKAAACYNTICSFGGIDLSGRSCCPGTICISHNILGLITLGLCGLPKSSTVTACENNGTSCLTAVGPVTTDAAGIAQKLFAVILSLSGGIALILIILSGYRLMTSRGNPEQVQMAREQLMAAIIGLLFVIFSLVILQSIGVNILNLPGFSGV